jgi:hypothetical protein
MWTEFRCCTKWAVTPSNVGTFGFMIVAYTLQLTEHLRTTFTNYRQLGTVDRKVMSFLFIFNVPQTMFVYVIRVVAMIENSLICAASGI